jgi:hypothetical protein
LNPGSGRDKSSSKSQYVALSLFESEADESTFVHQTKQAAREQESNIVRIDAKQRDTQQIAKLVGDMDIKKEKKAKKSKGDELLELMDSMDGDGL